MFGAFDFDIIRCEIEGRQRHAVARGDGEGNGDGGVMARRTVKGVARVYGDDKWQ